MDIISCLPILIAIVIIVFAYLFVRKMARKNKGTDCIWCGNIGNEGYFCCKCNRPLSKIVHILFMSKILLIPILLPIVAWFIVGRIQDRQRDIDREIATQQWKLNEYKSFCNAYIDYRTSELKIKLLLQNHNTIDLKELNDLVVAFDRAFNVIGYRLMPFDILNMKNQNNIKSSVPLHLFSGTKPVKFENPNNFHKEWFKHFLQPYFGGSIRYPFRLPPNTSKESPLLKNTTANKDTITFLDDKFSHAYRIENILDTLSRYADSTGIISTNKCDLKTKNHIDTLCRSLSNTILSVYKGASENLDTNYVNYNVFMNNINNSRFLLSNFFELIKDNIECNSTRVNYFNSMQMTKSINANTTRN